MSLRKCRLAIEPISLVVRGSAGLMSCEAAVRLGVEAGAYANPGGFHASIIFLRAAFRRSDINEEKRLSTS